MKRAAQILITFVLFAVATAGAQSLGDYARSVRKDKSTPTAASKHYDNDNLPKTEHLSIVGPPPTQTADSGESKPDEQVTENATKIDGSGQAGDSANASKDEAEERQKMLDEWKKRLEDQKTQIASAEKELDLLNREYRLRAAAMYADVGNRLRNSVSWDKEDREYKQQIAEKEKAVADAKQKLDDMQESARKAGVPSAVRE